MPGSISATLRTIARRNLRAVLPLLVMISFTSCATSPGVGEPASPQGSHPPAAWSAPALALGAVPPIYYAVWREAENRAHCALMAPARLDPARDRDAAPRAATFSGGWAVAYDLPAVRSAFGVAGTGASAWDGGVYEEWPHKRVYADGSVVGYGLEGGTGPNWLAYVRVPGQLCLYNVWSRLGKAHLETLLDELRFVTAQ